MTFVIGEPCIDTLDRSCIEVCPVACIYAVGEDPNRPGEPLMMVIDPEECIDCGACEPECPVEAINIDDNVPDKWAKFTEINAMHVGRGANSGPAEEDAASKQDIADLAWQEHLRLVSPGI